MTDTFRKQYNPSDDLAMKQEAIKILAEKLEEQYKIIGPSREMSLAMTNLEQSVMWAVKALYSN